MTGIDEDQRYENEARRSNAEFWKRLGVIPQLRGKRVLEVGCAEGIMSFEMGRAGARVLGVDVDHESIDYAIRKLSSDFPDLTERVTFWSIDVLDLTVNEPFDVIVAKDTLEHVADAASVMTKLGSLLAPGGILYVGFSPLFYSPFGHHGRIGLRVPWAHALLPRKLVYAAAARHNGRHIDSLEDIGLNGLTPRQFRAACQSSGLHLRRIAYNRGDKRLLRLLNATRRFRPFEKFATVSIYAELGA
jgi:SAM-dependent methyltransferase